MEKKGLCETCVNDKDCAFIRIFPVLECEEFNDYEPRIIKRRRNTVGK